MLVVDYGNRRADELTWVQVADSIGLTAAARRGAHNGWSARPDHDITLPITDPVNLTGGGLAVAAHGGQAGTVWDLYQVMGGESNVPAGLLGSRASGDCTGENGVSAKKQSTHGPDDEWLRGVYRVLICLMTDLGQQAIGPVPDKSDQDVPLIIDFMNTAGGTDQPRGVMMIGRDFTTFNNTDHPGFTATYFGGTSRTDDYRGSSGSTDDAPDLIPSATLNSTGRIYGVFGPCFFFNDALNLDAGAATNGAEAAVHYENTGSGGPWSPGALAGESGCRPRGRTSTLGGWTFGAFGGFGGRFDLSSDGTQDFTLQALAAMFGDLCNYNPTPVGVGDGPNSGKPFVNFMNLQSENPMKSGLARIAFGIAKTERVEVKIYDVTGRLVKTVANKTYEGGKEHVVNWDSTDDHGSSVARGVYFYQLRTPSFVTRRSSRCSRTNVLEPPSSFHRGRGASPPAVLFAPPPHPRAHPLPRIIKQRAGSKPTGQARSGSRSIDRAHAARDINREARRRAAARPQESLRGLPTVGRRSTDRAQRRARTPRHDRARQCRARPRDLRAYGRGRIRSSSRSRYQGLTFSRVPLLEHGDVAARHGLVHLDDSVEVHDRRAVDAGELRRIEPRRRAPSASPGSGTLPGSDAGARSCPPPRSSRARAP